MVAFLRVELAGSDDFGQLLHVGRFDVHYIKRLIRYLHMPKVNPENKGKTQDYCTYDTNMEIMDQSFNIMDIKPANMEELTKVITASEFHPKECNHFVYL